MCCEICVTSFVVGETSSTRATQGMYSTALSVYCFFCLYQSKVSCYIKSLRGNKFTAVNVLNSLLLYFSVPRILYKGKGTVINLIAVNTSTCVEGFLLKGLVCCHGGVAHDDDDYYKLKLELL